jgi:hypothetical protein
MNIASSRAAFAGIKRGTFHLPSRLKFRLEQAFAMYPYTNSFVIITGDDAGLPRLPLGISSSAALSPFRLWLRLPAWQDDLSVSVLLRFGGEKCLVLLIGLVRCFVTFAFAPIVILSCFYIYGNL